MPPQEQEIVLGLLNEVERDSASSQRAIAKRLGIALGLANAYLNRCVKKGFVKVREAPANRYLYYLTPIGFAEKARLSAEYLSQSFGFFRTARLQCEEVLDHCEARGYRRIALAGGSELGEIMALTAADRATEMVGVIDPRAAKPSLVGLTVVKRWEDLPDHDAVIITALSGGQELLETLAGKIGRDRVLAPPLLRIAAPPPPAEL
jgi:DNA-binding MarR family transcriptional regulator